MIQNILSVDVEEWFHPEAVQHLFSPNNWSTLQNRVEDNMSILLELFREKNVKATFFVLGWIAETYPKLVNDIVKDGHEIGTHGHMHKMVTQMTPAEFEKDLNKSIQILNKISGQQIIGFRAPTFSVVEQTYWSLKIMHKLGIRYDSSIYPIWHDRYGVPNAPRNRYQVFSDNGKVLIEFPMSTLRILNKNIPFGGGGYLRIFPGWVTNKAISLTNAKGYPAIMYLHPWEFDTRQPKLNLGFFQKWRHYYNIENNLTKLAKLLDNFNWTSFNSVL